MSATLLDRVKVTTGAAIAPLTVEQYHKMIETGTLRDGDPLELIDGLLVMKDRGDCGDNLMHGLRHTQAMMNLDDVLSGIQNAGRAFKRMQLPLVLADNQSPEPDAAIIRGHRSIFANRQPGPSDVVAVFEVSNSSLSYDRSSKLAVYAAAGIPVYVIVNLVDQTFEVYRQPSMTERMYAQREDLHNGQSLSIDLPEGNTFLIAVDDVLAAGADGE